MGIASETVRIDPAVDGFLARSAGLFIDGDWVEPETSERIDVRDPSSGCVIASVAAAGDRDVERAVGAAHRTFTAGIWAGLPPAERERVLLRLADLIEANAEPLAQLETLNQGKSINIARAVDVGGAPAYVRYVAGLATKVTGQTLDVSIGAMPGAKFTAYTRREPIGVVGAISPWNFPMMIGLWKVIPALAAGCSVVLKPSEVTPLTSLWLAELAHAAGVPDGVFNVITGDGASGRRLVEHPLVAKVSFTGSTATGKAIARSAADRLLRTSLELGGKNPAIFLKDVAIEQAVSGAILGGFFNNGQVCAASSRLYVAREIYRPFLARLAEAVDALTLGPGLDPSAAVNPVVSEGHRAKVLGHVEAARRDGANIVAGGNAPSSAGYYVRPTVIADAAPHLPICREEVFGPVVTVTPFDDEDDAIRLANDTDMGLAASLWTNDLKKTLDYVPRLQAGTVWVNCHNLLDPNMPFGGFKQSGIGRDFGNMSLESYTELKTVCIAH